MNHEAHEGLEGHKASARVIRASRVVDRAGHFAVVVFFVSFVVKENRYDFTS
jgi:hypothetical protein